MSIKIRKIVKKTIVYSSLYTIAMMILIYNSYKLIVDIFSANWEMWQLAPFYFILLALAIIMIIILTKDFTRTIKYYDKEYQKEIKNEEK